MMKRTAWRSIVLVVACATLAAVRADDRHAPSESPKVNQPLPFKVGEKLLYQVSFSKLIFGGTIGEIKLSVGNPDHSAKNSRLALKAEIASKGFFPKFFGLKVRDTYSCVVNAEDFGLHESQKSIHEGKNRHEQKAVIDRDTGRVTFTDRNLAESNAVAKTREGPSPTWIQDLLSATYFVRTQQLVEGDVIPIPISEGGVVYQIEVIVEKREEVKVDAGRFQTVRLNAKVFDGRYIHRSGEMLLWISDDAMRIPVRARVKTSGTTVMVDLKKAP